jgi:hypothetical protein
MHIECASLSVWKADCLTVDPDASYKSGYGSRHLGSAGENPSEYVSDQLRITREQLGDAIHELKAAGNLSPADRLSYMMMALSRMSTAMSSATSTTKSDNATRAFATLRFAGDALDPDEITRIVKERPTRAYRKGQKYRSGRLMHDGPVSL